MFEDEDRKAESTVTVALNVVVLGTEGVGTEARSHISFSAACVPLVRRVLVSDTVVVAAVAIAAVTASQDAVRRCRRCSGRHADGTSLYGSLEFSPSWALLVGLLGEGGGSVRGEAVLRGDATRLLDVGGSGENARGVLLSPLTAAMCCCCRWLHDSRCWVCWE